MNKFREYVPYAAFAVALIATLGSLSLSEVFGFVPCELCWYQRILMYPLVAIIGIAVYRKEANWPFTVLPIAVIGWAVALYHTLLQWGVIPEKLAPCVAGVSCVTRHLGWFGFITIPFLSFVAFSLIIALGVVYLKGVSRDQRS